MSLLVKAGAGLVRAFQGNAIGESQLTTGAVGGGLASIAESIESSVGTTGAESVAIVGATGKTMETLTNHSLQRAAAPGRLSQDDINRSNARIQNAKYKQEDLKILRAEIKANEALAKDMVLTADQAMKSANAVAQAQAKFVGDNAENIAKTTAVVGEAMQKAGRLTGRNNLKRALAAV